MVLLICIVVLAEIRAIFDGLDNSPAGIKADPTSASGYVSGVVGINGNENGLL